MKVAKLSLCLIVASGCAGSTGAGDSTAHPSTSTSAIAPGDTDGLLKMSLAGAQRTSEERARDGYRHPRETLEFFGLQPNMKVIELSAGGGWFTAVLAPVLRDRGSLLSTTGNPNGPPDSEGTKSTKALLERIAKDPSDLGKVQTTFIDWKQPNPSLGPDGSADMVLTFRNLHGWVRDSLFESVLASSFRVLKSGGVLGIEEHRAKDGTPADPKTVGDSGYTPEAFVIDQALKAGFVLAGKSEINANPKDTKDYAKGVWTLPPNLTLGDVDKDKYTAIGESDRMTLKFKKP
jgi:predicted methyltransferase